MCAAQCWNGALGMATLPLVSTSAIVILATLGKIAPKRWVFADARAGLRGISPCMHVCCSVLVELAIHALVRALATTPGFATATVALQAWLVPSRVARVR
jgi:hypothetical protein